MHRAYLSVLQFVSDQIRKLTNKLKPSTMLSIIIQSTEYRVQSTKYTYLQRALSTGNSAFLTHLDLGLVLGNISARSTLLSDARKNVSVPRCCIRHDITPTSVSVSVSVCIQDMYPYLNRHSVSCISGLELLTN
jgi:hypothetical protein